MTAPTRRNHRFTTDTCFQQWTPKSFTFSQTNMSFNFAFAKTSDFTKVSRKKDYYVQDWLWNLIWTSNNFENLASKDSYFKIDYWPQPYQKEYRKVSLQLSACFIQGAKITDVAKQLNLSINDVLRFVTACCWSGANHEASFRITFSHAALSCTFFSSPPTRTAPSALRKSK